MAQGINPNDIEQIVRSKFSEAEIVRLLWKGEDAFSTMHQAVNSAEKSICLEFYIFRNDETGSALADILIRKSLEGIRVRVIYDHFGSIGTPRAFWKKLTDAGIEVRASYPFSWKNPLDYRRRDHRKLILIDNSTAFMGGLNIANEYSGFHLRRKGRSWRDTGLMIQGPVVMMLYDLFMKTWNANKPFADLNTAESPENIPTYVRPFEPGSTKPAIPVFASSARGRRRFRKLLRYSLASANKEALLTTAYFTPGRLMKKCLKDAAARGVAVKLLLPMQSDLPAVDYAGRTSYEELLSAGVQIYLYKGDVLHAKSYVFDRQWSIIGSANLDARSLSYNDEGNIGIFDAGFGGKMAKMFEHDTRDSVMLTLEEWSKRGIYAKILERFFHLFRRKL
ncbi:MAG: phospholipase D-like domain-containing protein [Nitrospiraceae bacterium]|nr:phospholipase D-like domain-containing protein [Nitrospiraceae bacterium]